MSDPTDDPAPAEADPAPAAPTVPEARPSFRWMLPSTRYALTCSHVGNLREALAFAIDIGMSAEAIKPGISYRLSGDPQLFNKVRDWIAFYNPAGPVVIDVERPPAEPSVVFAVASRAPGVRSAIIHASAERSRLVALAVDAGLAVACAGLYRYEVTGATRDHLKWTAAFLGITHAQALERLNLTQALAAAEDAGPPPVRVELPRRETTSKIDRDRDGFIRTIEQLERSV